jgi:hypothetical protein
MLDPITIHAPSYSKPCFPSQTINKLIDEDTISALTKTERHAVASEISIALETVNSELDRSSGSEPDPARERWGRKARHLRNVLYELLWLIRAYEKERQPTIIELKAKRRHLRDRRRFRRQRFQIDSFLELVELEIGEDRLKELLIESGMVADQRCEAWQEGSELPEDPFNGEEV